MPGKEAYVGVQRQNSDGPASQTQHLQPVVTSVPYAAELHQPNLLRKCVCIQEKHTLRGHLQFPAQL